MSFSSWNRWMYCTLQFEARTHKEGAVATLEEMKKRDASKSLLANCVLIRFRSLCHSWRRAPHHDTAHTVVIWFKAYMRTVCSNLNLRIYGRKTCIREHGHCSWVIVVLSMHMPERTFSVYHLSRYMCVTVARVLNRYSIKSLSPPHNRYDALII